MVPQGKDCWYNKNAAGGDEERAQDFGDGAGQEVREEEDAAAREGELQETEVLEDTGDHSDSAASEVVSSPYEAASVSYDSVGLDSLKFMAGDRVPFHRSLPPREGVGRRGIMLTVCPSVTWYRHRPHGRRPQLSPHFRRRNGANLAYPFDGGSGDVVITGMPDSA